MRVTCVDILSPAHSNVAGANPRVTLGREYDVIGIYGAGPTIKYRLVADDGKMPSLQDARQFQIVCARIPDDWVFQFLTSSEWELAPASMSNAGFWEAFFDGDQDARSQFVEACQKIRSSDFTYRT